MFQRRQPRSQNPHIEEFCSLETAKTAFSEFSTLASHEFPALRIRPPFHILREDILRCLERCIDRRLDISELADVQRYFALDVAALISWDEFKTSLTGFNAARQQNPGAAGQRRATTSRARLMAARRKGLANARNPNGNSTESAVVPPTSSQEIGWYAGGSAASHSQVGAHEQYSPLKGTDITRGGEGRSLSSYYGPMLGRSF